MKQQVSNVIHKHFVQPCFCGTISVHSYMPVFFFLFLLFLSLSLFFLEHTHLDKTRLHPNQYAAQSIFSSIL